VALGTPLENANGSKLGLIVGIENSESIEGEELSPSRGEEVIDDGVPPVPFV